jgi:L-iditol 2-dehydrogenase
MVGTERDEPARLKRLREIGFETATVGADLPPLDEQVRNFFQGEEADALLEASGASVALAEAWKCVRPDGTVTAVALYGQKVDFDATQFVRKQIDLRTTYASSPSNYRQAIKLLQEGIIDFGMLTTIYDLQDAGQAFDDAEKQAVLKPVLACSY